MRGTARRFPARYLRRLFQDHQNVVTFVTFASVEFAGNHRVCAHYSLFEVFQFLCPPPLWLAQFSPSRNNSRVS